MCGVVQTDWLLCHLGKDYEIKSALTSLVLERYKHVLGKIFALSKHLSNCHENMVFKIFSQASAWKAQRILIV